MAASRYRVKEHRTEMGGAQREELFWSLQGRLQVRQAWLELGESKGKWHKIKERRQHRASEAYTLLGRSLHVILRAAELLAFYSPSPTILCILHRTKHSLCPSRSVWHHVCGKWRSSSVRLGEDAPFSSCQCHCWRFHTTCIVAASEKHVWPQDLASRHVTPCFAGEYNISVGREICWTE